MLVPFFTYLLECTNCSEFDKPIELHNAINDKPVAERHAEECANTKEFVKSSEHPFGTVIKGSERRFSGTLVTISIRSVAEYPFPAKIKSISGNDISVYWNDITGNQYSAILDPEDTVRIDVLKDRSPEAMVLRDSEKKFHIKEQTTDNINDTGRNKRKKITINVIAKEMYKHGISCSIIDNKVFFCDRLYLIDYSSESNEFEIVNFDGEYIATFFADQRGISRMLTIVKRIESNYDPEDYVDEILEIGD